MLIVGKQPSEVLVDLVGEDANHRVWQLIATRPISGVRLLSLDDLRQAIDEITKNYTPNGLPARPALPLLRAALELDRWMWQGSRTPPLSLIFGEDSDADEGAAGTPASLPPLID